MEYKSLNIDDGFDRLQRLLVAMQTGDDLRVADAALLTGLPDGKCLAVLEGLERAGLMLRASADRFVRCTLDHHASVKDINGDEERR
jgi:hypothetical protein